MALSISWSCIECIPIRFQRPLFAAWSGILLAVSYPGFNLYYFEWIAFVPLLMAVENVSGRMAYLLGTITGFFGIAIGFHWVGEWAEIVLEIPFPLSYIVTAGHSGAVAQVFGIIFFLFQKLRLQLKSIEIFLFPILYVSIFTIMPLLFKFSLGDAQSYFPVATQTIEFTGVHGLDCVILLINIVVYRLFFSSQDRPNLAVIGISLLIVILWFSVGSYRLQVWEQKMKRWTTKRIGLVQTNLEATLDLVIPQKPYSRTFPKEIALSRKLLPQKPEIIVWPEGNFFGYSIWGNVREAFRSHISQIGVPVLFHDITKVFDGKKGRIYNSTILVDENGVYQDQYDKMIRVPFGEYTPFTEHIPFFKKVLGDYLSSLSKGEQHKTFFSAGMKLVPIICYESLFPEFVAESIREFPHGKVMVVQSQDGWYGQTAASEQHLASSALRAIENRVPLIHVINNGRSGIVLPNGKYIFVSDFFQEGQWVVQLPYDSGSGGSFYSNHPYLFIYVVRFCSIFCMVLYWYKKVKKPIAV